MMYYNCIKDLYLLKHFSALQECNPNLLSEGEWKVSGFCSAGIRSQTWRPAYALGPSSRNECQGTWWSVQTGVAKQVFNSVIHSNKRSFHPQSAPQSSHNKQEERISLTLTFHPHNISVRTIVFKNFKLL